MLHRHIKKQKFHFSVTIVVLLVSIIGSTLFIKSSPYFNSDFVLKSLNYFKYKIESSEIKNISAKGSARSIPVLLYHGIVTNKEGLNVSVDDFKDQMFALRREGYKTASLNDFIDFIKGEKDLPEKTFLLTFDDGRRDSYYPADPILKALGYNAVIFAIGEHISEKNNSSYYLSKQELKEMVSSRRWEIQPHTFAGHDFIDIDQNGTKGHFYSNKMWLRESERLETNEEYERRIKNDFILAKNEIKNKLEVDSASFSFPFGDYGQESLNYPESKNIIKENVRGIFSLAFYQVSESDPYPFDYFGSNSNLSKRIEVSSKWNANDLLKVLKEKGEKESDLEVNEFSENQDWISNWGSKSFVNNKLFLESDNNTGSSVILGGTRSWKDYAFQANVNWKKGSNILLLARYNDEDNYLACNFSAKKIRIEKRVEGKNFVQEKNMDFDFPKSNLNLGVKISGTNIECMLDNKIIDSADIETDKLPNGGIGFKTWDPETGNSEIEINKVTVNGDWNKRDEIKLVNLNTPKDLPYTINKFDQYQGWTTTWGEKIIQNDELIIGAQDDTTGNLTFLDGSLGWINYSFKADVNWQKGNNILLLARYQDDNNYVTFNISDAYFRIEEFINGEKKIIEEIKNNKILNKESMRIGIGVDNERIEGTVDGKVVIYADSENINRVGGIGFKTWDENKNNSLVAIKEIEVISQDE